MQVDTALLGSIVDNLLGAYLAQRTARDTDGDALQKGGFPGTVRLLRVVVTVVAEYQRRNALLQGVRQAAESTQVFRLYGFQFPHGLFSILDKYSSPTATSSICFSRQNSS